jgi:hypothetical protein
MYDCITAYARLMILPGVPIEISLICYMRTIIKAIDRIRPNVN